MISVKKNHILFSQEEINLILFGKFWFILDNYWVSLINHGLFGAIIE